MSTTSKIAVIGLGNIGKAVVANLVKSNRPVIVASKKLEDAQALAATSGPLVTASEVAKALAEAEIIVLSVWFSTIQELLKEHAAVLAGKLIIDPSNPIAPDGKGGFQKVIGETESAGLILGAQVPQNATFVKALGSLGAASLANAAFGQPTSVLFYATDSEAAKLPTEALIHDLGFDPLYIGGVDQSIRIEVFGDLHEFGKLGKPVSLAEAKPLV